MTQVLVLGAGINGAAIARELTLNGISVWVVDRYDIASGTTAYSSRLIHGGLRYLEYGEFGLVAKSLSERKRLLTLAPYLVRPLEFHIPVEHDSGGWLNSIGRFLHLSRWISSKDKRRGLRVIRIGLRLYSLLARDRSLPSWQQHAVSDRAVPKVNSKRFRWICSYWDAQIKFPERLVAAMLHDAAAAAKERQLEFQVLPHHEVVVRGDQVRVRPVDCRDATVLIHPAVIVNATGAWVDSTLSLLGAPSRRLIGGTRGSHFVTFHSHLVAALQGGAVYAEASDGRPVFILPLGDGVLVGTTDLPDHTEPGLVRARQDEIDYLIAVVNEIFPNVALTKSDVHRQYAGVRPLPYVPASAPSGITRRSQLLWNNQLKIPVLSTIGGKLTTCRALGEDAAREVCRRLNQKFLPVTRKRPWPGTPNQSQLEELSTGEALRKIGISRGSYDECWELLGGLTFEICKQTSPSPGSSGSSNSSAVHKLLPGTQLPISVVRWIIRHEWVHNLCDLVERRLLLHLRQSIGRTTLKTLGALMVEEGRLAPSEVDTAVESCVQDLKDRFACVVD